MPQQKKNNQAGFAVACWILIALVLLIVFLIKQDDIMRVLKDTDFFKHTLGKEPNFVSKYESKKQPEETVQDTPIQISEKTNPPANTVPEVGSNPVLVETKQPPTVSIPTDKTELVKKETETPDPIVSPEQNTKTEKVPPTQPVSVQAKLCFVIIDSDGSVSRKEIIRSIPKTDSPLTATLNALLVGPDLPEKEKGCMSLIPEETRLLSASVKNKVATLNFSEEFEYNRYGVEGYLGQLMQVVYTATAFPTVESVQFLIEGQRKEYIGSEGVWIGTPLSITSFK